jgi:hypothetical protein
MKKAALAIIIVVLLSASLFAGVESVKIVEANCIPASVIWINSPTNTTYTSDTLILNYTVLFDFTQNKLVTYSLDGGENVTLTKNQTLESTDTLEKISGDIVLSGLSEGSHHLELYSENIIPAHEVVYFSIDTVAPNILIYSPENTVYNITDILLDVHVNEPVSNVTYSLDGQSDGSVIGSKLLRDLPYGEHNVTFYATDLVGNIGVSETIIFTIAKPESEPFPTTLFIVSVIAVAAVVGLCLLVYIKKYHKDKSP